MQNHHQKVKDILADLLELAGGFMAFIAFVLILVAVFS